MSERVDPTCCACSQEGITFVIDGAYRKPVCEQHGRMYRQQGYRIEGGPRVALAGPTEEGL